MQLKFLSSCGCILKYILHFVLDFYVRNHYFGDESMKIATIACACIVLTSIAYADNPATTSPDIAKYNDQVQKQLKDLQDQNQKQLQQLNVTIQNQIKQQLDTLQTQIQTLNTQIQKQMQELQKSLDSEIRQVQQQIKK